MPKKFPHAFQERYAQLLGPELPFFLKACSKPPLKSVRVNTLKASVEQVQKSLSTRGIGLAPVPFVPNAFYLLHFYGLVGSLTEVKAGWIQVQEAASMLPPFVLRPCAQDKVLDLAAAPGNKTIQLAEMMQDKGLLVALDANKKRVRSLKFMLNRASVSNCIMVLDHALHFKSSFLFDKILLDAPCSSEGVMQKKMKARKYWNVGIVKERAVLQRKMLLKALSMLKPGGQTVYSVCTLSPEECEAVVSSALKQFPGTEVKPVLIPHLKTRPGILEWQGMHFDERVKDCARVYPQDNGTQSFFMARLVKGME